jgi:D-alanyl-D-alanine carboxypeptidase
MDSDLLSHILQDLGLPENYGEKRRLHFCEEAKVLVKIGLNPYGKTIYLEPDTAKAWEKMKEAALKENIELLPLSGFRSIRTQAEIIRMKLESGRSLDDIMTANAPPGYSQHHTGRALDICTPGFIVPEKDFDQTPAFQWLTIHAQKFGFIMSYPVNNPEGFIYEPWHWYFVPSDRIV